MKCLLACLLLVSWLAVPGFVSAVWLDHDAVEPGLVERDALVYVFEVPGRSRTGKAPDAAGYQTEEGGLVGLPNGNDDMSLSDRERGQDMTPSIDVPSSVHGHKDEIGGSNPPFGSRPTGDPAVKGLREDLKEMDSGAGNGR